MQSDVAIFFFMEFAFCIFTKKFNPFLPEIIKYSSTHSSKKVLLFTFRYSIYYEFIFEYSMWFLYLKWIYNHNLYLKWINISLSTISSLIELSIPFYLFAKPPLSHTNIFLYLSIICISSIIYLLPVLPSSLPPSFTNFLPSSLLFLLPSFLSSFSSSFLFTITHWPTYLALVQYHTVSIPVSYKNFWCMAGGVHPFFDSSAVSSLFALAQISRIMASSSKKNSIVILIRIILNL